MPPKKIMSFLVSLLLFLSPNSNHHFLHDQSDVLSTLEKDILNNLQGKSNEESLWLLRCSKYEKNQPDVFKFRNVATMSTSNQHNLNIGISRCVLYRRTQKTGTLGKGARKATERKTKTRQAGSIQPAPPLRDIRMRAVG